MYAEKMWPTGEIVLDNFKARVHSTGSVVRGKLVVKVFKPLSARNHIKLTVKGWGLVYITKLAPGKAPYKSSKVYLDLSFFLWRNDDNMDNDLVIGIHEFPFEFQLPENIPSSYSGRYGRIQYTILPEIQSKKGVVTIGRMTELLVQRNIDSSAITVARRMAELLAQKHVDSSSCTLDLLKPRHFESDKIKGGLFHSSGHISFSVDAPRTYFCVGELIPLSGTVTNTSSSKVSLKAYLVQQVNFTAVGKFLWVVETIEEETRNTLLTVDIEHFSECKNETTYWSCDGFYSPVETALTGSTEPCEFIQISHYIRIRMVGSGITVGSMYIDIPVTIGNQPSSKDHTALSCHARPTGGQLQRDVTPTVESFEHGATPSAPPLTTAPNIGHHRHQPKNFVTGAYPAGLGHHDLREGHFIDSSDPSQESQLTTSVPIAFGNKVDNFQPQWRQPYEPETTQCDERIPTYDELFPEGGPSNLVRSGPTTHTPPNV